MNMRKTRVCCFCETWESGGIESFLYNLLTHMDLEQIEVDIVVSRLGKSVFTQELQKRGVHFYELSGSPLKILKNDAMFRKLLKTRQYDVVHFHVFQALSLRLAHRARRAGVPVRIAHSHNTSLRKSRTRRLKLWVHCCARQLWAGDATDFWACSQDAAKFMFSQRTLERRGWIYIPNGIDIERFRFRSQEGLQTRQALGLTNEFLVGCVGRLCEQKNQEFLLDVFSELQRTAPTSKLLLVGEGSKKDELREKAERLGIAKDVIFYGTSDQVEKLFWAMDVLAFPSLYEGLGIVAIEAQAAGLPVVCSERVPEETHVSPLLQTTALSEGAEAWANALLSAGRIRREEAGSILKGAGFEIAEVAACIQGAYQGTHRLRRAENGKVICCHPYL